MQIYKDNIHENIKRYDHDYQVKDKDYKAADKAILFNNNTFNYEIPLKGPFEITHC